MARHHAEASAYSRLVCLEPGPFGPRKARARHHLISGDGVLASFARPAAKRGESAQYSMAAFLAGIFGGGRNCLQPNRPLHSYLEEAGHVSIHLFVLKIIHHVAQSAATKIIECRHASSPRQ